MSDGNRKLRKSQTNNDRDLDAENKLDINVDTLSFESIVNLQKVIASQLSFEQYQKQREILALNSQINRATAILETIANFHIGLAKGLIEKESKSKKAIVQRRSQNNSANSLVIAAPIATKVAHPLIERSRSAVLPNIDTSIQWNRTKTNSTLLLQSTESGLPGGASSVGSPLKTGSLASDITSDASEISLDFSSICQSPGPISAILSPCINTPNNQASASNLDTLSYMLKNTNLTKEYVTKFVESNSKPLPEDVKNSLFILLDAQINAIKNCVVREAAEILDNSPLLKQIIDAKFKESQQKLNELAEIRHLSQLAQEAPIDALKFYTGRLPFHGIAHKDTVYAQVYAGQFVRMTCPRCKRDNLKTLQGFVNHVRLSHGIAYPSHPVAIKECGQLVNPREVPPDSYSRKTILNSIDLPRVINVDWGKEQKRLEKEIVGTSGDIGAFVNDIGEEDVQASFSAIHKEYSNKTEINVYEPPEDVIVDIESEQSLSVLKKQFRKSIKIENVMTKDSSIDDFSSIDDKYKGNVPKTPERIPQKLSIFRYDKEFWVSLVSSISQAKQALSLTNESIHNLKLSSIIATFNENKPLDEVHKIIGSPMKVPTKEKAENKDEANKVTGSRFYFKKKIQISNFSQYVANQTAEHGLRKYQYKWMIIVAAIQSDLSFRDYIKKVRFFLHPDYKPYDVVETAEYPYRLTRFGYGEFPVRIQIFFHDSLNKPVDIVYQVKLDPTMSGKITLSPTRTINIEIDRNSTFISEKASILAESTKRTSEQVALIESDEVTSKTSKHRTKSKMELRKEFMDFKLGITPLTLSQFMKKSASLPDFALVDPDEAGFYTLGWRVATSEYEYLSWPLGIRKSIEYRRAKKFRQFLIDLKHPDFSERISKMEAGEIMRWLSLNKFTPELPQGVKIEDLYVGFNSVQDFYKFVKTKEQDILNGIIDKEGNIINEDKEVIYVNNKENSVKWCKYCGIPDFTENHEKSCEFAPRKNLLWKSKLWSSSIFTDPFCALEALLMLRLAKILGCNVKKLVELRDNKKLNDILFSMSKIIDNSANSQAANNSSELYGELLSDISSLSSYKKNPLFVESTDKTKYNSNQRLISMKKDVLDKFITNVKDKFLNPSHVFSAPLFLGVPIAEGSKAAIPTSHLCSSELQKEYSSSWGPHILASIVYPDSAIQAISASYNKSQISKLKKDGIVNVLFFPQKKCIGENEDTKISNAIVSKQAKHIINQALYLFLQNLLLKTIDIANSEISISKQGLKKRKGKAVKSLLTPLHLWKATNSMEEMDFLTLKALGSIKGIIHPPKERNHKRQLSSASSTKDEDAKRVKSDNI